ncbi:MAG: 1-acyl-sn-glycerol-3-phosphate acyltransferase [Spirochaetales bacterium]|nr:1-acyl-sn-glycerol-3-phosphate acyltransferase [Spirochaetales bacterium]
MITYTPICFIVWLFTTPFDYKKRLISHRMNTAVGYVLMVANPFWRTKIYGLKEVDKDATYVIASNHQSLTDICILSATRLRLKWVSKKELTFVPFLGWIMAMAKYVLLDRKDPKSQIKMMKSCENYLNNNVSIAIFPEGTRSKSGELGKFRDGAALLARKCNRKILPVAMYGNNTSMPKKGWIWKKINNQSLYFLDPIDPADYSKTGELTAAVKDAIQKKLDELKDSHLND